MENNGSKLHFEQLKNMMQNWLILKCLIGLQHKKVTHVKL